MQNDILQVVLRLENNQHIFSVLQKNEHLYKKITVLQFIIVDVIRAN